MANGFHVFSSTVWVYLFFLPFQLVDQFTWYAIPGVGIAAFIFLTTWAAAIINPSILSMIESIAGPVIAMILYLMPMYAIRKMPALEPYRGRLSNVFVTIAGLVAVSGIIYGLVS